MKDHIDEHQAIANPFNHRSYPSRPNPSPFAKRLKATPVRRTNMVTRCKTEKKLSISRKINVGYHSRFLVELACPSQESRRHITGFHIYPTSCTGSYTNFANHSICDIYTASHSTSSTYPASSNLV